MHKHLMSLGAGVLALAAVSVGVVAVAQDAAPSTGRSQAPFRIGSAYIVDGKVVAPSMVGSSARCGGGWNQSPQLSWVGVPAGTKSLALGVFDPDARQGQGFSHWLVYNIPASATGLEAGAGGNALKATPTSSASDTPAAAVPLPDGAVNGANGTGKPGYTGPCPPAGDKAHRYVFTLYALDMDSLNLPAGATAADLPAAVDGHTLGTASVTALYAVPAPPSK